MIWFRHYVGLCRDPKFVSVAFLSSQPIERVVWVWCAILESTSERENGSHEVDAGEAAYFLRCERSDVESIMEAMQFKTVRLLKGSKVSSWARRQYKSDVSTERVRRHREKKKGELKRQGNVSSPLRNVPETPSETESSLEKKTSTPRESQLEKVATPEESEEPNRNSAARANPARRLFDHWNAMADLVRHREFTPKMKGHAIARLNGGGYTEEQLADAIGRYAELCRMGRAPGYNHWGFGDLMARPDQIDKMLDPNYQGIVAEGKSKSVQEHNAETYREMCRRNGLEP